MSRGAGSRPEAVIVDMDGTLHNSDGNRNGLGFGYVREQHYMKRTIIVVTARDHEWSYEQTHKWLVDHMPVPFIGPFCRPIGDDRSAVPYKKAVYERLSHLYDIVSAIDDNPFVLEMWESLGLETVRAFDSIRWTDREYMTHW